MAESRGKGSAAQRIADEFVECRTLGHSYIGSTSTVEREKAGRLSWSISCDCGTTRTQLLSREGKILSTSYHYPKGYLLEGEFLNKSARADLRLRYIFEQ